MQKFTDIGLKNLKPQDRVYDLLEGSGDGFLVRVFPSGEKSLGFFYNLDGKRRRMTFGRYPKLSLAKTRELHANALKLLIEGKDPSLQKQIERSLSISAPTVNEQHCPMLNESEGRL